MKIREVFPVEYDELGRICVAAYAQLGHPDSYRTELMDVAGRVRDAQVWVAIDPDDTVLGGVTYVPGPESPLAEFTAPDAASFRMLAVNPAAQGRGVGRRLIIHCLQQAQVAGKKQVIVHSTPTMQKAHHLYESLGFVRCPELDWEPVPEAPSQPGQWQVLSDRPAEASRSNLLCERPAHRPHLGRRPVLPEVSLLAFVLTNC